MNTRKAVVIPLSVIKEDMHAESKDEEMKSEVIEDFESEDEMPYNKKFSKENSA